MDKSIVYGKASVTAPIDGEQFARLCADVVRCGLYGKVGSEGSPFPRVAGLSLSRFRASLREEDEAVAASGHTTTYRMRHFIVNSFRDTKSGSSSIGIDATLS